MAGKRTDRTTGTRQITMTINGQPVELNGFVQDAFQEVITGLVRSLGEEDETGAIELHIAAAETGKRGE